MRDLISHKTTVENSGLAPCPVAGSDRTNLFAGSADLQITIRGDNLVEGNETFRVLVEAPAGVRVIYVNGTITIHDND